MGFLKFYFWESLNLFLGIPKKCPLLIFQNWPNAHFFWPHFGNPEIRHFSDSENSIFGISDKYDFCPKNGYFWLFLGILFFGFPKCGQKPTFYGQVAVNIYFYFKFFKKSNKKLGFWPHFGNPENN